MLVIRMQRTGRKGHAQFRVVVQDSRRTPTSGRVVAALGNFNPHTKEAKLDKEKAQFYLDHGAQPSERVIRLLKAEGLKLPKWVKVAPAKEGKLRNPEKLRKNRPSSAQTSEEVSADKEEKAPAEPAEADEVAEAPAEEPATEEVAPEAAEEANAEVPAEETAESDTPAEETTEA